MLTLAVTTLAATIGIAALLILIFIPATVTALEGHWTLFSLGFLVAGIIWWITALRLARPHSFWARHFYGDRKMKRSWARYATDTPETEG